MQAPAVDGHVHVAARRALAGRSQLGRPEQLEVGTLRADEQEVAVVEHHVHDDRADDGACLRSQMLRSAWSMLRSSDPNGCASPNISHLHEPDAAMLLRAARVLGKVQPEAADAIACAVIELDRRSQAFAIQRRALPDREGAVRAHAGTHLCGASPTRRCRRGSRSISLLASSVSSWRRVHVVLRLGQRTAS